MDWYDIPGWFGAEDAAEYQIMLEQCRDEGVIEVGSYAGRSAVFAAPILRMRGCRLICVDSWDQHGPDSHLFAADPADSIRAQFDLHTAPHRDVIEVMPTTSLEAAHILRGRHFGLIFLDAHHSYDAVVADITAWLPRLRPGGVICGHDWPAFPSVRAAVRDTLPQAVGGQIWRATV